MIEKKAQGGSGGGMTDIDIISSRNTIEVEREGNVFDVNVASEGTRNFYVKNFKEFMDAVKVCGQSYIDGDPVQNVIQLLDHIDMTAPTADDAAEYVVNMIPLIDIANKKYNFSTFLYRTKIISYGQKRALQTVFPENGALDTWQISAIRLVCENIVIGGELSVWRDYFHHGSTSGDLPARYQRYLFNASGNFYYDFQACDITCCGAPQNEANSFNPFIKMSNGSSTSAGLYVTWLRMENCRFTAGGDTTSSGHANLNAPIVINSDYHQNRSKEFSFKQMSKQVNDSPIETNVPNIQLMSDDPSAVESNWESYKWSVFSDGTILFSCAISEDCIVFTPKLALNDLYLQGTELTPAGNPPTENYVSLVELLKQQKITVTTNQQGDTNPPYVIMQPDEANDNVFERVGVENLIRYTLERLCYLEIPVEDSSDGEVRMTLLPFYASRNFLMCGTFYGVFVRTVSGEYRQSRIQRVYAAYDYDNGTGVIKTDMLHSSGTLKDIGFSFVSYAGHLYFGIITNGHAEGLFFIGDTDIVQSDLEDYPPTYLYYKQDTNKWYSDKERTQEVTFTEIASAGRFPADLDFGGNSSQVVAGDGSLLDWNEKLGYWKGVTANLPPVGSREANKLYITTDY